MSTAWLVSRLEKKVGSLMYMPDIDDTEEKKKDPDYEPQYNNIVLKFNKQRVYPKTIKKNPYMTVIQDSQFVYVINDKKPNQRLNNTLQFSDNIKSIYIGTTPGHYIGPTMEFKPEDPIYKNSVINLYLFTIDENDVLIKYDKTSMPSSLNQKFSAFGTELVDIYFDIIQREERRLSWNNSLLWYQKMIRKFWNKNYGNFTFDPASVKIDLGEYVVSLAKSFIYKNLTDKEKKLLLDTIMAVSIWTKPVILEPKDVYQCL